MSPSAPDVITYIGVPLAVLGVLPIIYNTISTLATLAKVRRMLQHGRLAGIARGDVVNHVIEVELPRYTLAPLHREEEHEEYWRLCEYPSHIPGGSWTIFNWRTNPIGRKTQRIDYPDQLRQPQAEIGFEELISFLLDLGAVPDEVGFRLLRGSGLWVPTGTPLLLSPNRRERVLTIAPLDDSDGHLSLAVQWSSTWGMRDHRSLPPYWVLIKGAPPPDHCSKSDDNNLTSEETNKLTLDKKDASADSSDTRSSAAMKYTPILPPAIRCKVGVNGLLSAIPDDLDTQIFESLDVKHLEAHESSPTTKGVWFASAITALGTTSQTILWNYKIPPEILAFAKKDSIPCGVLVLLDVVEESATPEWATRYENDAEEEREQRFREMSEDGRAVMREQKMTPEERTEAVRERSRKKHENWIASLNATRRRNAQRAETRMMEAFTSPKWGNKLSAEHYLVWLKKDGHMDSSLTLERATEVLLWRMINEPPFAEELTKMLDGWKSFVDNGGLKKGDYSALNDSKVMFGYATLLVAMVEGSVTAARGSLAMDLQECVRIWKRVRLG
ncbi:hypothetical protein OIDMADRAFT_192515 [Oidiodendron maius Zn]|uniref:Uncharacterized protein n=1 Tax=Oidiodendron maius (strain Zn) TaxID=913774 RepID=A0A0C3HPK7_OIDMZ|nr:hypothetical protein OIDMADRAFT_192515 [Oidiodendron maius Zn]